VGKDNEDTSFNPTAAGKKRRQKLFLQILLGSQRENAPFMSLFKRGVFHLSPRPAGDLA